MNCCKHKYFVIYRGDDTDFPGNQELIVELNTERDLTGCSAHFSFQGFTQDFAEIPADKKLHLIFPSSETKKFALGAADAKLWLTNGTKVRTVESRIHVVVTNRVDEAYDNDDPQAITVTISGGGGGATVVLDDTVTETSSNGVKSSGIWSWVKSLLPQWLTSDYAEPATVASVEVKADKATTLAGYGITDAVPFVEDSEGNKTAVTIGSRTIVNSVGPYSLANGDNVTASGNCSHAEGDATTASGNCSHAEGSYTNASGDYSHAEGEGSIADGQGSHAEGGNTIASGTGSHTDGINSRTRSGDHFAFAWNGDDERSDPYLSHGQGTFNINPVGGLAGFYIGEQTLPQVINATIDARLPYPLNAVADEPGLLKDRAINTTSLASVTVPDDFTDLLVRASVASSLAVTMPTAIATKYGDTFPGEAGEYLITITKTGAAEAYVRTIKLEEVA